MSTPEPFLELESRIQSAIANKDWSLVLYLAGQAIVQHPEPQFPFVAVAQAAYLLGDHITGNAYLQLAKKTEIAGESRKGAVLLPDDLDRLVEHWVAQSELRKVEPSNPMTNASQQTLRLVAGGDVMLGRQMPGWVGLRGAESCFAGLAPVFQGADIALANLETCVSTVGDFLDKGGRQPYYYHCLPEMLDVVSSAGIHCLATGNNHAMDFGASALAQQTQILESSGFLHFGAGCDSFAAAVPKFARIKDMTVAFIGVETETPYMAATSNSAGVNYVAMQDMVRKVAGSIAMARAHADIVIVSPHWGVNWEEVPTAATRACARQLLDLGADAILGHSAHILQGVEFHAGRPIIYDMGTLLFDRVVQSTMKDSALFDLTWDAKRNCRLTLHPVRLRTARALLAQGEDFDRISALLSRLSTDLDPAVVFETSPTGLHLSGQPESSALRQIEKCPPKSSFDPTNPPKVTEEARNLRSNLVYNAMPNINGVWPSPLIARSDLHILGARFATPVRSGRGFVCEVYFRASAPPVQTRVEARIAAFTPDGEEVFGYTHPVAEGIHPPARWRMEDIICDRISVRPVKVVPDGVYKLCWSMIDLESGETLIPDSSDSRLFCGQVLIGDLVVSAKAPSGVVGIAAPPRLPRAEPSEVPQYGGWRGRVRQFWQDEAYSWVDQALKAIDLSPTSTEPIIVREAPLVLVVRVETKAGAYFFKALGTANHFEVPLVNLLVKRWSDRIATPLATRPERGWMLTPDYGEELRSVGNKASRAAALQKCAAQLAEIQIASCQQVEQLLAIGISDRRLNLLPALFEKLLSDSNALHVGLPDGLSHDELTRAKSLLPFLGEVCHQLEEDNFCAGLDHGDLHLGNLLVKGDKCVIHDWDTAWVSHPFCSLLSPYHATGLNDDAALQSMHPLNTAYLRPWSQSTGKSIEELLPTLHLAIWVAHVKRALFWASVPEASVGTPEGQQGLISRWIRRWLHRRPLLASHLGSLRVPADGFRSVATRQPDKLATIDNPLLLDSKMIADITGGVWSGLPKDVLFTGFSFNRHYMEEGTSGNLYIAARHDDRHTFSDAETKVMALKGLKLGAAAVVVPNTLKDLPDGLPLLRISPDINALDLLGIYVRDRLFSGKRVLVSGTEGKTGFKNMLHHVLSPQISTHAVTNSSNLGFSIMASLASIRKKDRVAILEAAGTHPGRLSARSSYAKPHMFVLTEVGNEHINFHGSQQAVIESKADIVAGLVDGGFGLINADSRNYAATRKAILARKRVPLSLFGSESHCNGRLLERQFKDNAWTVTASIEGQIIQYRLPLLGDHAPLASVYVLLAAYYMGADVAQAAAEFENFRPYESQGALRQIAHKGGEITCYDNASRASVLSYQSTLGMAAKLTAPSPTGKKVAVIGQMIFLGDESENGHAQLAPWIDAAGFDRIILVGKYTEVTFAHLKNTAVVIQRFPEYDRRTSSKAELNALIDATEAACNPGDLLFIKGEVDELGEHLRTKELPPDAPIAVYSSRIVSTKPVPAEVKDESVLAGLRPLQLSDLPLYRAAIDQTTRTTWQHYFPFIHLLGQSAGHQFLVGEDAGSFCIYLLRESKNEKSLSVFLLPMPAQPAVIERCIQRVKAFNKGDRASLFRVDPADTALFKGRLNTRIVTCMQEYIYHPANYVELSGNKKRNLRRAILSIEQMDGLEVLDYEVGFAGECRQVLKQWAMLQSEKYGGVHYGGFTNGCLDTYDHFPRRDLFGKVIRLDGRICSFGFAGEMRSGMGNLFITYSDHQFDGLNKFLYRQLLLSMQHLEFANASHDGGEAGLAFAKQALGPAYLFQPFQVYAA